MKQYSIGLYEKALPDSLSWAEKLICARDCGYDYLEISIDETDAKLSRLEWTREERLNLVQTMYETGLPIRSMCLSGHRKYPLGAKNPAIRQRGMEIMEQAIQLADDLGIRLIQLAGYDAYYEQDQWDGSQEEFLNNLTVAAHMAAAKGIALGFETMETAFMNTVWKSLFYVNQVNNPWLGIYPDSGNLNNAALESHSSVLQDLRSGQGHLFSLHLKATKPGIFRNMYFDDPSSQVDFSSVIETAWNLGVRRYVTELWYLGNPNWKQDVLTANQTMRRLLDQHCCK